MYAYRLFGLDIASEIDLGEGLTASGGQADVTVRRGSVPAELADAVQDGGWFAQAPAEERRTAQIYLKTDGHEIHWDLIHAASASVANLAIYPLQDVLGLGTEARMNLPSVAGSQWRWRCHWDQFADWHAERLALIGHAHGRRAPRG